jgi:hypothetical protein
MIRKNFYDLKNADGILRSSGYPYMPRLFDVRPDLASAPPAFPKYAHSVIDVAVQLHCIATGTLDDVGIEHHRALAQWLTTRLAEHWDPQRSSFDVTVRKLATQALLEWAEYDR